jgi:hypothetical protein
MSKLWSGIKDKFGDWFDGRYGLKRVVMNSAIEFIDLSPEKKLLQAIFGLTCDVHVPYQGEKHVSKVSGRSVEDEWVAWGHLEPYWFVRIDICPACLISIKREEEERKRRKKHG